MKTVSCFDHFTIETVHRRSSTFDFETGVVAHSCISVVTFCVGHKGFVVIVHAISCTRIYTAFLLCHIVVVPSPEERNLTEVTRRTCALVQQDEIMRCLVMTLVFCVLIDLSPRESKNALIGNRSE